MTKVIFVTNKLIVGGVERALIQMIKKMSKNEFDITIGVCHLGGELENELDKSVKIIELPQVNSSIKYILLENLKRGNINKALKIIFYILMCRINSDYNKQCEYRSKIYENINEEYDVAICYHKPTDLPVPYVLNNIQANGKILWIHMDISSIKDNEKKDYYDIYTRYNRIICISNEIKRQVINLFPEFKDKSEVVYNFIDEERIKMLSNEGEILKRKNGVFNILTVGRLSPEKGHLLIIEAVNIMRKINENFKWYIVGDGPMKIEIQDNIDKNNLNKYIKLLGNKKNPYGFFKSCDIYVQPSLSEGYGITISEAKVFNKPIIITKFATAKEHMNDNYNISLAHFNGRSIANKILETMEDEK